MKRSTEVIVEDGRVWVWPVALAAMIFVASGRSQVAAPDIPSVDKIAHFFVYGLLGTLCARVPALRRLPVLGVYSAVVLASLYGMADEFHQSFTPGRQVEVADWVMDTAGALVAVVVYAHWTAYQRWLESPVVSFRRPSAATGVTSEYPS